MFKKILVGLIAAFGLSAAANAGDVKFRIVIGSDHYERYERYEPRCWTNSYVKYRHGRRVVVRVTECERYSYDERRYERRDRHHRGHRHRH